MWVPVIEMDRMSKIYGFKMCWKLHEVATA